jgi:hypothetical protein
MTREEFKEGIEHFSEVMLRYWDEGRTVVSMETRVASIDATKPGDRFMRYKAGSIRITITMKDPREKRPEEFT